MDEKTKTKWKRSTRDATQRSDSMEAKNRKECCICLFFEQKKTRRKKCLQFLWCFFLFASCALFSFIRSQNETSGKNLSKCVSLFISSGYYFKSVSWIWWEFFSFFVGWKKGYKCSVSSTWNIFEKTYTHTLNVGTFFGCCWYQW